MSNALDDLIAKYERSMEKIPEGVAVFKGVEGTRAARLAAQAVTEQVLGDLRTMRKGE